MMTSRFQCTPPRRSARSDTPVGSPEAGHAGCPADSGVVGAAIAIFASCGRQTVKQSV